MIAGLLFIPTTIFDMIWGVRYLQEARGLDYARPCCVGHGSLGWIIGCPLLGFLSDRIGRRKPVILVGGVGCWAAWRGSSTAARVFPPYVLGLVAGVASGAAMLPYTVIKEANPPRVSGTATGVVNFLNFTFSALLGPVFGWVLLRVSGGASHHEARTLPDGVRAAPLRCRPRHPSHVLPEGNRPGDSTPDQSAVRGRHESHQPEPESTNAAGEMPQPVNR